MWCSLRFWEAKTQITLVPSHSFSFSFISHSNTSVSFSPACSCHLCGAGFCLCQFEGMGGRVVNARNGEVAISGRDRNCPAQAGLLQNVAEFVVRPVEALGACCSLQGEDPVLQAPAVIW